MRLNTKDFISLGVFNALFLVLFMIIFFTVGLVPVLSFLTSAFVALVSGAVFQLMGARIGKPGVYLVSSALQSVIFLLLGGFNPFMLLFVAFLIAGALAAEGAARIGRYRSAIGWGAGYVLYMTGIAIGFWGPILWLKEQYKQYVSDTALLDGITGGFVAGIIVATSVAACAGAAFGQRMLRKHVRRSGLLGKVDQT